MVNPIRVDLEVVDDCANDFVVWSSPGLMDTFQFLKESVFHAKNKEPVPCGIQGSMIALARAGRSVEDLAREFEPCTATIHGWIKQAAVDDGDLSDGLTSGKREELQSLRRKNKQLRQCLTSALMGQKTLMMDTAHVSRWMTSRLVFHDVVKPGHSSHGDRKAEGGDCKDRNLP